jgi:hypothetical protein
MTPSLLFLFIVGVVATQALTYPKPQTLKNNYMSQYKFVTNKMCPYAQKVWIALEVFDVPYSLTEVSLYGPNGKPSWFLKLNPRGTVPVLLNEDSGEVYPDSDLILDYLNLDKSESSLKEIESWRNVLNARLIPIGKRAVLNGSKKSLHELKEVLLDMELLLKIKYEMSEGSYVKTDDKPCTVWLSGGKEPNVADCSVFPFIWRLQEEFHLIDEDFVLLHDWLQSCSNSQSFKKTIQSSWWWWW